MADDHDDELDWRRFRRRQRVAVSEFVADAGDEGLCFETPRIATDTAFAVSATEAG